MNLWTMAKIACVAVVAAGVTIATGGIGGVVAIPAALGIGAGLAGVGPLAASLGHAALPMAAQIAQSTAQNVASDALAKPIKRLINGEEKPDVVVVKVSESTFKHDPKFIESIGQKFELNEQIRKNNAEKAGETYTKRTLSIEITPSEPESPSVDNSSSSNSRKLRR